MDSIVLLGAEAVQSAASRMALAAETMRQAAWTGWTGRPNEAYLADNRPHRR